MSDTDTLIAFGDEVQDARTEGRPIMALESTIITHGLPRPQNATIARAVEQRVRDAGATPATIAIVDGRIQVGLDPDELDRLASDEDARKASVRDIAVLAHLGRTGSTTVAATAHIARLAGIDVFATGGIGGVHRDAAQTWDESADLAALARISMIVVSSGIKSILDVGATLEKLETLGVGVCGYGAHKVPGFYLSELDYPLDVVIDNPQQAAALFRLRRTLGDPAALLVFQPVPTDQQMSVDLHDHVLAEGLQYVADRGISGKDVTPQLLSYFRTHTDGESLRVNTALILNNAALAAQIAVQLHEGTSS